MNWFNSLAVLRRWASTPGSLVLRPYQEDCIQACLDALRSGCSRIGVSSPTGTGKTTMFVSLIARLSHPPGRPTANRSLIIVNSIELARQAAESVRNLFPDMSVEIEQGQRNKASGIADVTIATYQTLLQPERLLKFDRDRIKAVVVDEAHHAAAPSYRHILSHFDPAIKTDAWSTSDASTSSRVPIVGFSATFSRHDGLALGAVFERIVYHRDFLQMIKENWLCRVRFTSVKAQIDLSGVTVNSKSGDFNATSLAHVINTMTINALVVQSWLDRAAHRKSTLVFCVNLAHVFDLTHEFRVKGVDARFLHGKTPAIERKTLLEGFRKGEFPILVNCAILTEGADIPNIDCVVVAKPTRSRNVFAQMIGRGMRLSPATGKDDCHIVDFVDSSNRINGAVSTPTLLGLEPDMDVIDQSLEDLQEKATGKISGSLSPDYDVPLPETVTFTDYDNPWSLVNDGAGSPHIIKLSQNAWVACGNDTYILECLGKGFIKVQPSFNDENEGKSNANPHFVATYTPAPLDKSSSSAVGVRGSFFFRKRQVLTADTLERAVRGCDTYAVTKVVFGHMVKGLLRTAKWRGQPATDGQKTFLTKRLRLNDSDTLFNNLDSELETPASSPPDTLTTKARKPIILKTLTKGQAANIITRLQHGAVRNYETKAKGIRKANKAAEKISKRIERETIMGFVRPSWTDFTPGDAFA